MKQLSITFLLTVLMSMVGTKAFAYDIEVANDDGVTIYYNFINDGTELEVTYKDKIDWNRYDYHYDVVIPESVTYNGKNYNVTSIGWNAFSYADLTSVTIPNSVNTIDCEAFYNCWNLTSINIPISVTSIGSEAFYNCWNLTSFNIPISVTSIGSAAFDGTPWYDLQPDGLVYAGKFAYKYKGEMPDNTSITIKDGTLGIAECAFEGCVGLISITIPNSVTFIGNGVFRECSGLTTIVIPNSVTKVDCSVFSGCTSLTSVTISDNITFIGSNAFQDCSSLSSITIPENVTSIGSSAFSGCNNLATITFPNNVISIGRDAFSESEWYDSQPDGLVYAGNILYKYKGEMPDSMGITIIDGTKGIAGGAFSKCNNLVSITIPNSVVTIGNYAFVNCI